jgi:hypothetical protein
MVFYPKEISKMASKRRRSRKCGMRRERSIGKHNSASISRRSIPQRVGVEILHVNRDAFK